MPKRRPRLSSDRSKMRILFHLLSSCSNGGAMEASMVGTKPKKESNGTATRTVGLGTQKIVGSLSLCSLDLSLSVFFFMRNQKKLVWRTTVTPAQSRCSSSRLWRFEFNDHNHHRTLGCTNRDAQLDLFFFFDSNKTTHIHMQLDRHVPYSKRADTHTRVGDFFAVAKESKGWVSRSMFG